MVSGMKGSLQNSPLETSVEQRQHRSTAEAEMDEWYQLVEAISIQIIIGALQGKSTS